MLKKILINIGIAIMFLLVVFPWEMLFLLNVIEEKYVDLIFVLITILSLVLVGCISYLFYKN